MKLLPTFIGLFAALAMTSSYATELDKDQDLTDFLSSGEKFQLVIQSKDSKFAQRLCREISRNIEGIASYQCYNNELPKAPNRFNKYRVDITDAQKEVKIVFTVLHPNDDDIQKVSWILQNPQSPKYDEALSAVGQKLVDYEQYGDLMKDVLFYRGLSTGDTIRPSGDLFSIRQEGFSRLIVDKKLAKEIFMREKESNRNFLRGGLEVATFLGIGKGLYILV